MCIDSLSSAGQIILLQLAGMLVHLQQKMIVRANICAAVFKIFISWSNILGHSHDINFFSSYMLVLIYLMTFLREKNIFPIQWGKLVHTEVREFFWQKLIFAVFSTVLGVFRP
jgi:hypothetical protein